MMIVGVNMALLLMPLLASGEKVEKVIDGGHTPTAGNHQNASNFDRSFAIPNGKTVNAISVYSTVAGPIFVKIAKEILVTEFDIVVSESFSHDGTGWDRHDLPTPYLVPATGSYRAGEYDNLLTAEGVSEAIAFSKKDANQGVSNGNTGWATNGISNQVALVRVHYI